MSPIIASMTNFGDLAILLPLAALILLGLLAMRCQRGALAWLAAAVLCGGTTGVLKIYFFACPWSPDLVSPSGHTSLSTLVYGAVAVIVAAQARHRGLRIAVGALGAAAILTIGTSRILLNVHTTLEVCVGLAIGVLALAIFAVPYLRYRPRHVSLSPLAVAAVVVVALLHGHELHAEGLLHALSTYLGIGAACS
jgi:membrane-associated phospholipid phosphatase